MTAGPFSYDEHGVPASGNSGLLQYAGRPWLPQAGVYDNRARAYNPGLGRFMQTDPIGQRGGLNIYDYTGGDPVNFTDPSGLYSNGCFHHDRKACAAAGYLEPSQYWPSESEGGFHPNLVTLSLYGSVAGLGWANVAALLSSLTYKESVLLQQFMNTGDSRIERFLFLMESPSDCNILVGASGLILPPPGSRGGGFPVGSNSLGFFDTNPNRIFEPVRGERALIPINGEADYLMENGSQQIFTDSFLTNAFLGSFTVTGGCNLS